MTTRSAVRQESGRRLFFEIVVTVPSEEAAKKDLQQLGKIRSQKIYASIMNELSR